MCEQLKYNIGKNPPQKQLGKIILNLIHYHSQLCAVHGNITHFISDITPPPHCKNLGVLCFSSKGKLELLCLRKTKRGVMVA